MGSNTYFKFRKSVLIIGILFIISLILIVVFFKQAPVRIGFVGGMTGRGADLGIAGRNGVVLAVEEINESGGINGRPVILVTKDDEQNAETAARVDNELIKEKVVGIIGHMTSSMSIVGASLINDLKTFMISPTASTDELTDKDDYFFRVYPANYSAAKKLAAHAYEKNGYKKITVLYDYGNKAHTLSWFHNFKETFEKLGGTVVYGQKFSSGPNVDFLKLAGQVISKPTDCIFVLANALDTALFCQQLMKLHAELPIIASEWSATNDVLMFGGKAVEGMQFLQTFDRNSQSPKFLRFKKAFVTRFGNLPGFASVHAYDSATILFKALKNNPNPANLKQTIVDIGTFETLQGKLTFNKFGDINRNYFWTTIKNGHFISLRENN